jgi:hypothetical protein
MRRCRRAAAPEAFLDADPPGLGVRSVRLDPAAPAACTFAGGTNVRARSRTGAGVWAAANDDTPTVAANAAILIRLSGRIIDSAVVQPLFRGRRAGTG